MMIRHTKVDSIAFFFFKAASSSAMAAVCAFLASAGGPEVLIVLNLESIKSCPIQEVRKGNHEDRGGR